MGPLTPMPAVFDTNVLIDHLSGVPAAAAAILAHPDRYISRITWIEVMVGANRPGQTPERLRAFLSGFGVIELDSAISEASVAIRQTHKVKLPDAVVYATARSRGLPLLTLNTNDFPAGTPGVVIPYTVPPSQPIGRKLAL
jgi:hypothetical protein